MPRKDFIKSKINLTQNIINHLQNSLHNFLTHQKNSSNPPFHQPITQPIHDKQINKFKKYLTDWRSIYSQTKFKKTHLKKQSLFIGKQNIKRPQSNSLSFAKSTYSSNSFRNQRMNTPNNQCRKIHSSFSTSNQKLKAQPFNKSLTPFYIVQNIYQSNVNNLQHEKRAQTARVRQYYERKAQKVEQFKPYDKLSSQIINLNQQQLALQSKDFIRTDRNLLTERKQIPIYQRKKKRLIMPDQFYKNYNKVKIPRKFVFKEHQIQTK